MPGRNVERGGKAASWALLVASVVAGCAAPARVPESAAATPALVARSLPRVTYRGGPFLRSPRIITVTFAQDEPHLVSRLEQFGDTITRTPWWRQVAMDGHCTPAGACVGEGRRGVSVRLDANLPADLHALDLEALLSRQAESGRFGRLDADTLLLVYLPPGVVLSDAFVPRYCGAGPRAFHSALRLGAVTVAHAVMPRCGDEAELTSTASHELVEAVTNPDPARRGFAFEQSSATLGFTFAGVEPVDPCGVLGLLSDGRNRAMESGFAVQRVWSNRAAGLGRDPCVPSERRRPYLALIPGEPTVRLAEVGSTVSLALTAAADRPVPAWAIAAVDLTGQQEGEPCVTVSLDRASISAGETATLRLAARRVHPRELCIVALVSRQGSRSWMWPLAVVMR